ncbi:MAG: ABC transporter substrate-binding protein [Sarcina sp.]
MNFKKLSLILLSTVIATGTILTGCGAADKGAVKEGEVVTLKWYSIGQEPKDLKTVLAKANEYLGEKIGVNIDMKFVDYGDYNQKMSVLLNTAGDYDLAFTCSWAGDYLGNARKGAFLELDSYLDNQGKDMKAEIDERFWEGAKIDGKIYAVPNQKELAIAPMFMFDKELVEKYDIPYEELTSMEKLEPWLKLIKEKEPSFVPFYKDKIMSFAEGFDHVVDNLLGFRVDDKDLKVVNFYETQEVKDRALLMKKYYDLGYINADSPVANDDRSIKRFAYKADGQPHVEGIWSRDYKRQMVTVPMYESWVTNSSTTGSMIGVSKNTKYPEKAVEFLNLLNTDEYLRNLINFGVEGVHYDLTDKGQVKLKEPVDYNVSYMSVGNLFKTYTLESEPETKWDDFKKFNDEAKMSESLGFKFDTSSVQNELAALANVVEEYKALVYSGSVDVEKTLKACNEKLYAQGLQKVIDEMQKQVDAWKASK